MTSEFRKLEPQTLAEALRRMAVGETVEAPDGYSVATVRKTCTELIQAGYLFQTSQRTGTQTITRLK